MQCLKFKYQAGFCVTILITTCISFSLPALAVKIEEVPNPRQSYGGWVTDMANILSPATEAQLNQKISQLEAKNGSEIAVVTVSETAPSATPKQFATSLFNYWRIGKAGKNNGVLFLISKGDRRVEIETGSGLQTILPDAQVTNLIKQNVTPKFKQSDFDGGTLAGTQALVIALETNPYQTNSVPPISSNNATVANSTTVGEVDENSGIMNLIYWLIIIGGSSLVTTIAYALSRRDYIEPTGKSRIKTWFRKGCHCANCQQRMKKVNPTLLLPYLSKEEQVAQKIGSLNFEGWQCPNCHQSLADPAFHIRAYENTLRNFYFCPNCQELTMKRQEQITLYPTEYHEGIKLITSNCQCCSYSTQKQEIIPRRRSHDDSSSYSSNSSSDSSSSSSSDFGGGSSDGGGGGDSW